MKLKFRPENIPLVFIVLIIVFIVIGIIYSSAIKRNIFCSGPFVFLPTCDLSMLVLPELNEPVGSICQTDKQCNGFRRGVKCCKGVCVITGCDTCDKFCKVEIRNTENFNGKSFSYKFRTCGRQLGQPCVFDTDCRGFGEPEPGEILPGPAKKKAICCGGVCRTLDQLPETESFFKRSCKNFCEKSPEKCFNYSCRI